MRSLNRMVTAFFIVVTIVATAACENGDSITPNDGALDSLRVSISPKLDTLPAGVTKQLTGRVYDARNEAHEHAVDWRSQDPSVASVSSSGLVAAVIAGVAHITASAGGPPDTATIVVLPAPPALSCSLVGDLSPRSVSALAKPDYLQSVIEPDFRTTLARITGETGAAIGYGVSGTWPSVAHHYYAKDPAWTADQRLVVLKQMKGTGFALFLDGDTYQPLFSRSGPPGGGEWRLHPTIPDVATYMNPNGTVGYWNVRTNSSTTLFAVAGYSNARLGPDEGNLSADGRYLASVATRATDGRKVVYVVDLVARAKSADIDVAGQGVTDLDWASVSEGGRYLVLHGVIGGLSQRTRVYDRATLTLIGDWTDHPLGHFDLGIDAAGNEVAFGRASSGTYSNRLLMRRLDNGAVTPLLPSFGYFDYHASTRNLGRPGWGLVSVDAATGTPFDLEVFWVKLDGSQTVQRLVHHRNLNTDYDATPFAVPSPDGRRVLFASNWGASSGRPVQDYVLDTRPLCP